MLAGVNVLQSLITEFCNRVKYFLADVADGSVELPQKLPQCFLCSVRCL
jgi:hypothetical protein